MQAGCLEYWLCRNLRRSSSCCLVFGRDLAVVWRFPPVSICDFSLGCSLCPRRVSGPHLGVRVLLPEVRARQVGVQVSWVGHQTSSPGEGLAWCLGAAAPVGEPDACTSRTPLGPGGRPAAWRQPHSPWSPDCTWLPDGSAVSYSVNFVDTSLLLSPGALVLVRLWRVYSLLWV